MNWYCLNEYENSHKNLDRIKKWCSIKRLFTYTIQFTRDDDLGQDDERFIFASSINLVIKPKFVICRIIIIIQFCVVLQLSLSNVNIWWTLNMIVGQSLFKDYFKHIKTYIRFALTWTYVHIWREFFLSRKGLLCIWNLN